MKNLSSVSAHLDIIIVVAENSSCLFPVCTHTHGSFRRRVRQWGRRHYGNISLRRVFLSPPSLTNRFSIAKVFSTAIRPRERGALSCKDRPSWIFTCSGRISRPLLPPTSLSLLLSFAVTRNVLRAPWRQHLRKTLHNDDYFSCDFDKMLYQMSSESLSVFPIADSMTNIYSRI